MLQSKMRLRGGRLRAYGGDRNRVKMSSAADAWPGLKKNEVGAGIAALIAGEFRTFEV